MTGNGTRLLDLVLGASPPPFALLHRPEATGADTMEVLVGAVSTPDTLAAVELRADDAPGHDVLLMVPYRQIVERGFAVVDDGEPLIALTVADQATLPVAAALDRLPDVPVLLTDKHFDIGDDAYADLVRKVITEEIGTGEGSNFVIRRSFVAEVADYSLASALSFFRRLVQRESGAYWTFIVHTGDRTFVGASPERHISLAGGTAVMNPMSGTYRYPASGPSLPGVLRFLADRKESDELYMVVDEELKMMAGLCGAGGRVVGPRLKEMGRLAHTEYLIEGETGMDPRDILRATMFAPTVTGSPLENAFRVIARTEPLGRGYYSGVVALLGRDRTGTATVDSAILIRTADIDRGGRVRIGTGATLVRHSVPADEVAETKAKVAGLLAALESDGAPGFGGHPSVRAALELRNTSIAGFWLAETGERDARVPELAGVRVLVVDSEDTFTAMLAHILRSLGTVVTVRRFDEDYTFDGHDLVVLGPGPGDPRADEHPKIAHLAAAVDTLLAERRPFVAVCLSHQVLARRLGLPLTRLATPNQGVQREISLFGTGEHVGFYNTFAASSAHEKAECLGVGVVEVCREGPIGVPGEVHALRGPHFTSMQFHAESLLTREGERIIGDRLREALGR
ncbi:anthranilate synthase family protein [Actinokineospora sp. NBRC 105648]|uniref:anthranilate synthase family protein n=1 Tax=Actinokineospora sp. NBRC 105648 TaxID=3032206 RepID=UPI0024A06AA8|nr:anthranilate synthase family protein [Actinokineospora sp. NBRC 105648]GLZ36595.1 phenazine-specific anthranilate synthase component I [Actinokineospora sp. NBRC 105648]